MIQNAPVIAAIDVGTNSFHLIIASINQRKMMQIHSREREVVRLGSSSGDMKYILPDAMERGVNTMIHFYELAKAENAEVIAVATSAVREAENKDEFLEKVKKATGIDIQVVSGPEEGRLVYIGAIHALPIFNQQVLILDIGGGSTETIIGLNGNIKFVVSAKLGAIRLTKKFFSDGKINNGKINECREFIIGEWTPTFKRLVETGYDSVVGTAGTIQNLAAMTLAAKKERIPDVLNGLLVTKDDLLSVIKSIVKCKSVEDIQSLPGMDPGRADIILAGALILEQIILSLNIPKILISTYSLKEGIVFDSIQKKESIKEYPYLSHLRYETVYSLCNNYKVDCEHSEHVKKNSLVMFDALQPYHRLTAEDREHLEAAALLHDIGYSISHDQHHKHSYYIISHCIMPGFTNDEAELIAIIARYHRKSHPKKKHEEYQKLSSEKQRVVKILAGILRIAEGIDRRQLQNVADIKIEINPKSIDIHLIPVSKETNLDIELWGAKRRKLLLEEVINKEIDFFADEI